MAVARAMPPRMAEADRLLSPAECRSRWALLIAGPSVVLGLWFLAQAIGSACPLRIGTDLACPLCGGTRSTFALLQGELLAALRFNLVAPAAVLLVTVHAAVAVVEALRARRLVATAIWQRLWLWLAAAFLAAWLVKLAILLATGHSDPAT